MKAPYYIVSDNHFMMNNTQSEIDRREKLFKVFEKIIQKGKGTLIIGGDFFDFWFGSASEVFLGFFEFLPFLLGFIGREKSRHFVEIGWSKFYVITLIF